MKHRATISMGASRWQVSVNVGGGEVVTFDLRKMTKDSRRKFIREFVKAFREGSQ